MFKNWNTTIDLNNVEKKNAVSGIEGWTFKTSLFK